jgi:hypothetical protein
MVALASTMLAALEASDLTRIERCEVENERLREALTRARADAAAQATATHDATTRMAMLERQLSETVANVDAVVRAAHAERDDLAALLVVRDDELSQLRSSVAAAAAAALQAEQQRAVDDAALGELRRKLTAERARCEDLQAYERRYAAELDSMQSEMSLSSHSSRVTVEEWQRRCDAATAAAADNAARAVAVEGERDAFKEQSDALKQQLETTLRDAVDAEAAAVDALLMCRKVGRQAPSRLFYRQSSCLFHVSCFLCRVFHSHTLPLYFNIHNVPLSRPLYFIVRKANAALEIESTALRQEMAVAAADAEDALNGAYADADDAVTTIRHEAAAATTTAAAVAVEWSKARQQAARESAARCAAMAEDAAATAAAVAEEAAATAAAVAEEAAATAAAVAMDHAAAVKQWKDVALKAKLAAAAAIADERRRRCFSLWRAAAVRLAAN